MWVRRQVPQVFRGRGGAEDSKQGDGGEGWQGLGVVTRMKWKVVPCEDPCTNTRRWGAFGPFEG